MLGAKVEAGDFFKGLRAHKTDLEEIAPSAELWKYQLAVEGRNIPITDALVLAVLDSHGRIVTRLSGKL